MRADAAETLALKALGFLAAENDAFERFLRLSGVNLQDLRERAADPLILAAVLDFILTDDALVVGLCDREALNPRLIQDARRVLPGG
jgi:hypothetical protein